MGQIPRARSSLISTREPTIPKLRLGIDWLVQTQYNVENSGLQLKLLASQLSKDNHLKNREIAMQAAKLIFPNVRTGM